MHVFVIHLPVHAYSKAVMPENDFFGVNLFHFPSLDCSSFFIIVLICRLSPEVKYRNNVKYSRQDSIFPSNQRPGIQ